MARMLGRLYGSHCPSCRGLPGPDCADKGRGTRLAKRLEEREQNDEVRAYLLFCLELSVWLDDYAIPAPGDD